MNLISEIERNDWKDGRSRREKRYRILVGQLRDFAPDVVVLSETDKQSGFTRWVVGSRDLVRYIRLTMLASSQFLSADASGRRECYSCQKNFKTEVSRGM